MLIETTAGELKIALAKVKPAIERRNTIPVLSCVLFSDRSVRTTNLDLEITCRVASKRFEGEAAVPFYQLNQLIRRLPADVDVRLQVLDKAGDHSVHVLFSGGRYRLSGLPATDFPDFPESESYSEVTIPDNFCLALSECLPFISTEETRYYLNGVCFSKDENGEGVLVATDGHKLIARKFAHGIKNNLILPHVNIPAILNMGQPLMVKASDLQLDFHYPGARLRTKLIDGTFPDWSRVAVKPVEGYPTLQFSPLEMKSILSRLTLGGTRYSCVDICANASGDLVTLSHTTADRDEGAERLSSGTVQDWGEVDGNIMSFNAAYLSAFCSTHAMHDEIVLVAASAGSPAFVGVPGGDVHTVLMPMRGGSDLARRSLLTLARSANDAQAAERAA